MSWRSSKQDTMVDSTTEAEYITASNITKEAVWIKNFVFRLGVVPTIKTQWTSIVKIMGLLLKPRSPSHISDQNTYSDVSTSFVRSLREKMLRYVEFILMNVADP